MRLQVLNKNTVNSACMLDDTETAIETTLYNEDKPLNILKINRTR